MAIIKIPDGNAFKLRVTAMVNDVPADLNVVNNIIVNFVRRGRIAQPFGLDGNGRLVIANDGSLARGLYGVELTGYHDGKPWRHYIKNAFKIVDENEDADTPTVVDDVPVYDLSDNMSFGGDGVTAAYVDAAIDAHNEDEEAHAALQAKMAGKVDDVLVDGESVVETDPITGKRTVGFRKDQFGKVDDVLVNGRSVVGEGGVARIDSQDFKGERGNGITSIDVEESPVDGGDNIVHIHCTDDEEVEGTQFRVKNGSRGNGIASVTEETSDQDGGVNTHTFTDTDGHTHVIHTRNGQTGRPGADRQPVEAGDVIIAHSLGGDEEKVMSQNAVSEALGSQALGSGLYEESVNLSGMLNGTGLSISADGEIATSSVTGAKIEYCQVRVGDVVKIKCTNSNLGRAAWGIFANVESGTQALFFENYASADIVINKEYIFNVPSTGYFVIYSLNTHTATVMRGKGDMTNRKIPFNTYVGGGIYVADVAAASYGTVGSNANRRYTDYIDVSQISRLAYSRPATDSNSKAFGMAFYDANKAFISGESNLTNRPKGGYELSVVDVPSNAVYARFTLWEKTSVGEFFVMNADTDAMAKVLLADMKKEVSAMAVKAGGNGTTFSVSQNIYLQSGERIVKFNIRDNTLPLTDSSTEERFVIMACDSSGNVLERLYAVPNPSTPRKEIIVVTPSTYDHLEVRAKCNVGYQYEISVEDVTNLYVKTKLAPSCLNAYNPATTTTKSKIYVIMQSQKGAVLAAKAKSSANLVVNTALQTINAEHQVSALWVSYDQADHQVCMGDDVDMVTFLFKKSDNSNIVKQDVISAFDLYIYRPIDSQKTELKADERRWEMYGFTEVVGNNNNFYVTTNYLAIPKIGMSVRMDIPNWLKVRFRYGKRESEAYTDYFYSGDVCTFEKGKSAVYAEFRTIESVRGLDKDFYDESMSITILDVNDGDIIQRNKDTEKWLGAIKATPDPDYNYTNDLPVIAHVSDVHGDFTRLQSAFDYADYLGVDLVINTGDNYYYTHNNGVDFMPAIIGKSKSQYAGCLGNHDTYIGNLDISTIYNTHIAPYAEEYGWHKESAEDVTDKCYYYKDLDAKLLRIIALDIYEDVKTSNYKARISQTQIEWFIATLASTPEGYGVIVIMHQAPHGIGTIEGKSQWNDSGMDADCASVDSAYMTTAKITGNPFGKIIDAFIGKTSVSGTYSQKNAAMNANETISYSADFSNVAEGVEFICYLNGHTHRDWVGYVKDCEHNQLNINLCSANPISQGTGFRTATDIFRDSNGVNQDAFNVYTINREDKTVGIVRIGSCITNGLQERRVTFVSYV